VAAPSNPTKPSTVGTGVNGPPLDSVLAIGACVPTPKEMADLEALVDSLL